MPNLEVLKQKFGLTDIEITVISRISCEEMSVRQVCDATGLKKTTVQRKKKSAIKKLAAHGIKLKMFERPKVKRVDSLMMDRLFEFGQQYNARDSRQSKSTD